jgi:TonB-linked SusC/RagA family outer membrane protein
MYKNFTVLNYRKKSCNFSKIAHVMKLTGIILMTVILQVSASTYGQKITLRVKKATLQDIFLDIQQQSGYDFVYSAELLKEAKPITLAVKDASISEVIEKCMEGQPFTYLINKKTITIREKDGPKPELKIQPEQIIAVPVKGTVTDDKGKPLPGVTVLEKGTTNGTVTNAAGNYTLKVANPDAVLVFSFIGFDSQEQRVGSQTTIDIKLMEKLSDLNEVVVVGYGHQKKITLTGAVSSIKGDDILTTRNESLINMVAGKIPGVRIVQGSAEPGAFNNTFDIRGFGSPLVIIDGVPRDNFAKLDPNDIEDFTVLKDASAAVYGVRAANGVVLITTKKGKAGTTQLSYSVTAGFQYASGLPDLLKIKDWLTLANEKSANNVDNITRAYTQADFDAYANGTKTASDWYPAVIDKTAPQIQHSLTMSGGTDKTTYFASVGYENQQGFWKSGDLNYDKYNVRTNISTKISNRLTADIKLSGIADTRNQPSTEGTWAIFRDLWRHPPNLPMYANNDPNHLFSLGDNGLNSLAMTNSDISGYQQNVSRTFQGSIDLLYRIPYIDGLTAKGFFSYDGYTQDNKAFQKTFNLYTYSAPNYTTIPVNSPSNVTRTYSYAPTTLLQGSINYEHSFGAHHITALVLYEQQDRKSDNFSAYRNLVFGNLDQIGSGSSAGQVASQNAGGLYEYVNRGLVDRINYDYKSKYLLEVSSRYDGSSKFPPGKQWGFFPAVSAGWRVSEESFIKNTSGLSFIDNLKLRGSYGILGDDGSSTFQFLQGYNYPAGGQENGQAGGYVYNGVFVSGLGFRNLANPNITWFTSKTLDLGLDLDLWKGLLGVQVDAFQRNRSGLLTTRVLSLPSTLGATLPQENINSDQSRGLEVEITHNYHIGGVSYHLAANVSYERNKNLYVERAADGNDYANWRNNTNNRYNDIWWGYGADGRFQSFQQIYNAPVNYGGGNRGTVPGDYKYQDYNNDGTIDDLDRHPIGATYNGSTAGQTPTPNPGLFNFGFNLGASYKNFDFNAVLQGVLDKWISYSDALATPLLNNGNGLVQFMDRWHPVNPLANPFDPNTQYVPGYYAMTGHTADPNSTFALQNASYLRLKSIQLGYSLPVKFTKKLGIQKARIYVNGYDILTFTSLRYVDPEHPSDNYGYVYPLAKTCNLGIDVTF